LAGRDRRAIRPHTRASRDEIERALEELVEEGVVRRRRVGAVASYALTAAGASYAHTAAGAASAERVSVSAPATDTVGTTQVSPGC